MNQVKSNIHPVHAARQAREQLSFEARLSELCQSLDALGCHYEILKPDGSVVLSPVATDTPVEEAPAPKPLKTRRLKNRFAALTGYRDEIRRLGNGVTRTWNRKHIGRIMGKELSNSDWSSFCSSVRASAVELLISPEVGTKLDPSVVRYYYDENTVKLTSLNRRTKQHA